MQRMVPKVAASGISQALGSAHTVHEISIPGTIPGKSDNGARPHAVELFFRDGSGGSVDGRVGFGGAEDEVITPNGTSTDLGYHRKDRLGVYFIPSWAKVIYVCSSTASAVCNGSWLYT